MFKVLATGVVISKGFDNNPALKFSEKGDSVRFRVGQKVYDSRVENNTRWVNHTIKAFGSVCERIEKMQLKEGSFVNFVGRLDEDTWTDEESGEIKRMQVIILDEIEYASGGGKKIQTAVNRAQSSRQNRLRRARRDPSLKTRTISTAIPRLTVKISSAIKQVKKMNQA